MQKKIPIKLYSDVTNFGDLLGLTISQKLAPHLHFKIIDPYKNHKESNFLSIGSILQGADSNSSIWGSGFIASNAYLHSCPKAIYAVRGPLTNKKIEQQGLPPAKILGDPAYLIQLFFNEPISTSYKFGIVPHYVDKKDNRVLALCKDNDVLIIDPQQNPETVITQIKKCRYILSSSLHGLICADAFEIPSVYIRFSYKISGGTFKFVDYFLSCGRNDHTPYIIDDHIDFNKALKKIECFKNKINVLDLKDSFPFLR